MADVLTHTVPTAATATITLTVGGMTCASCVRRVERVLSKTPGVISANVNLATEQATVTFVPTTTLIPNLISAVDSAGYQAEYLAPEADLTAEDADDETPDRETLRHTQELAARQRKLIVGSVLTIPILILSMFFMDRFVGENWLLLAFENSNVTEETQKIQRNWHQ